MDPSHSSARPDTQAGQKSSAAVQMIDPAAVLAKFLEPCYHDDKIGYRWYHQWHPKLFCGARLGSSAWSWISRIQRGIKTQGWCYFQPKFQVAVRGLFIYYKIQPFSGSCQWILSNVYLSWAQHLQSNLLYWVLLQNTAYYYTFLFTYFALFNTCAQCAGKIQPLEYTPP